MKFLLKASCKLKIIFAVMTSMALFSTTTVKASPFLVYYPLDLDHQIVTTHFAESSAVLREALVKFFDGPSEEAKAYGAFKPFKCTAELEWTNDEDAFYDCGSNELLGSIRIKNGTAIIEIKGLPNAPTSGGWEGFWDSLELTVTQFKTVDDIEFIYRGYRVSGGDSTSCNQVCFVMLDNDKPLTYKLLERFSVYGYERFE